MTVREFGAKHEASGKYTELRRLKKNPQRYLRTIHRYVHESYKNSSLEHLPFVSHDGKRVAGDGEKGRKIRGQTSRRHKLEEREIDANDPSRTGVEDSDSLRGDLRRTRGSCKVELLAPRKLRPVSDRLTSRSRYRLLSRNGRLCSKRPQTAKAKTTRNSMHSRLASSLDAKIPVRPLSRWEYFDLLKEHRQRGVPECAKRTGALSATVPHFFSRT